MLLLKAILSCFVGLSTPRKVSASSRKTSRVTFHDEILLSKELDTNEKQTLKEVEPPKENLQSSSSPLSNDSNSTGIVNKELSVSVLDLHSDDESNDTSRVSKEPIPIINLSAASLKTESAQLTNSRTNGKPLNVYSRSLTLMPSPCPPTSKLSH